MPPKNGRLVDGDTSAFTSNVRLCAAESERIHVSQYAPVAELVAADAAGLSAFTWGARPGDDANAFTIARDRDGRLAQLSVVATTAPLDDALAAFQPDQFATARIELRDNAQPRAALERVVGRVARAIEFA